MEIFALGTEFIGSSFAYLAEVALLALVASAVHFREHLGPIGTSL
jgi:hypothetical protein